MEFDSEHAGQVVSCPLCGRGTELCPAEATVPPPTAPPDPASAKPALSPAGNRTGCVYLLILAGLVGVYAWLTDGKDWADLGGLGRFGWRERIYPIAPVKVVGAEGETLALAHKTTRFSLLLGIYLRDDGYVLAVEGQPGKYYPFPEDPQPFQAAGNLPSPLPAYRVPIYQYVLSFAFWWVVLPLVAVGWVMRRRGSQAGAGQGAVDT